MSTGGSLSDRDLLARLHESDMTAFDAIVLQFHDRLEEYARRMLRNVDAAEDIVQDVFLRLWDIRETLSVQGTLQSYLYGSVRNQALLALRRLRLEEQCATEFLTSAITPGLGMPIPGPDIAIERQELALALERALATLSPRVREVALLRWRDKLSRAEIAGVFGSSVPTVSNQLTIAARTLRMLLLEHMSETGE